MIAGLIFFFSSDKKCELLFGIKNKWGTFNSHTKGNTLTYNLKTNSKCHVAGISCKNYSSENKIEKNMNSDL